MIHQRKKKNSSKVNLTISVVFHVVVILIAFVFAAREGMLGTKLKLITATLVPKEKKPEPPKPKPEEPKPEEKPEERKVAAITPSKAAAAPVTAPPVSDQGPAVAPAPAVLSGFEFGGGKEVVSMASDPKSLYKAKVERALREAWKRPGDIQDDKFVARVDVSIEPTGRLAGYRWISGSGNNRWDGSVREVLESTKNVGVPPKGFPASFEVRFDVETEAVEGLQLSKL
jgi:protein TonB